MSRSAHIVVFVILSILTLVGSGVLATGAAQEIQREDPLSREIKVFHYKIDSTTQKEVLIEKWDWLDYENYYQLISLSPTNAVVPEKDLKKPIPLSEKIVITEASAHGDMQRIITLGGGRITVTFFTYEYVYYDDVFEMFKKLTARTLADKNENMPSNINPFFTATLQNNKVQHTFRSFNPQDVESLKTVLARSPKLSSLDEMHNKNDFKGPDAIHITVDPGTHGLPQQIDFDRFQIRTVGITPNTRVYRDQQQFWESAIAQKTLRDKYKSMGIENAPKSY